MEPIFDLLSEDSSDEDLNIGSSVQHDSDTKNVISAGQTVHDKPLEVNSQKYTDRVSELEKRRLQLSDQFSRCAGKVKTARAKRKTKEISNSAEERGNVTTSELSDLKCRSQKSGERADMQSSLDNKPWLELKPFLTINDHLADHSGDGKAKTGLEKRIAEAVSKLDLETAVTLSDQLAERDFGKKIAAAIDAKVYTKKRKLEEEQKADKHRKKLPWGFEHKQRWETKGNM